MEVVEGQIYSFHGNKTMHHLQEWSDYLIKVLAWKFIHLIKNEDRSATFDKLIKKSTEMYKLQIGQIIRDLHEKISMTSENDKKNELDIIVQNMEYLNEFSRALVDNQRITNFVLNTPIFLNVYDKSLDSIPTHSLMCWAHKLIEKFGWKCILLQKENNVSRLSKVIFEDYELEIIECMTRIENKILSSHLQTNELNDMFSVHNNLKYLHHLFEKYINRSTNLPENKVLIGGSKKKSSKKSTIPIKKTSKKSTIPIKKTSKKTSKEVKKSSKQVKKTSKKTSKKSSKKSSKKI